MKRYDYWNNPAYRRWWELRGKKENEICEECGEIYSYCKCRREVENE